LELARSSASRVLKLQPEFTINGLCASFDFNPSLADPLSEALKGAGLPS